MDNAHQHSSSADVTVVASAAHGLGDFIRLQGGDPDSVFGNVGLNPELLADPTLHLPLTGFCGAFEEASRQTRNDNFGLDFGRQFKPANIGLLGYIALSSPTLGDAFCTMSRLFAGHQQNTLMRLRDEGSVCRLEYQILHCAIQHKRQDAEMTMAAFTNLARHALGNRWAPEQVLFEHLRPEGWHKHSKFFDAPVLFGQPRNAMIFKRSCLERPMPDKDGLLLQLLSATMQRNLPVINSKTSLVDSVRREIQQALDHEDLNLKLIAGRLNLTSWTFQRRLNDLGLTFTSLVDDVRWNIACNKLTQSSLPISELAVQLGFSEVSAFSRAFSRTHGMSPRQWRQSRPAWSPL